MPKKQVENVLIVRSAYRSVKINFADILYIESVENYLKIVVSNGQPIMTLMTIKNVLEKLPKNQFVRIHRSYIVPANQINSIQNKKLRIGSTELPVSKMYLQEVLRNQEVIGSSESGVGSR